MRKRTLAVLTGCAFLATLALHAPAALLYRPKEGAAVLSGLQGTLSAGQIGAIVVNGRPVVTDLAWNLRPWWFLLLHLTADVTVGGADVAHARVSRLPFGAWRIRDLEAGGEVKSLLVALGQPPLPVQGRVRLALPNLKLKDGAPVEAQGTFEVQGLAWSLAREPLALGDFSATLDNDDKGVVAQLASGPGPLELEGEAHLAPDRSYDLALKLRPRPDAGEQLQTLVRSLGTPDGQGWIHVRRQGTL